MADEDAQPIVAPDDDEDEKKQPAGPPEDKAYQAAITPMPAPAIQHVASQAPVEPTPTITAPLPGAAPPAAGPQPLSPGDAAVQRLSKVQQENPFAMLMAKESNIHNPFLRILAKSATGIGAGAEGLSKEYPAIEQERIAEANQPAQAAGVTSENALRGAQVAGMPSEVNLRNQQAAHEQAETAAAGRPKLLTGEGTVQYTDKGEPTARLYENPDGSTQWVPEGQSPQTGVQPTGGAQGGFTPPATGPAGPQASAAGPQRIAGPAGPQVPVAGPQGVTYKPPAVPTPEEAAKLAPVGDAGAQEKQNQIKDLPGINAADFPVKPTDSAEQAEKTLADARAQSAAEEKNKSDQRVAGAPAAAEQRKMEHNYGYSTDKDGQVIYTTEAKAGEEGNVFEPVSATDVNKDRQALGLMGNVQLNASNYKKAVDDLPGAVSKDSRAAMEHILADPKLDESFLLKSATLGALSSLMGQGERAKDWNKLSPPEQNAVTEYLRAKGAVIAYQRALTNQGRTNPEALMIEFDTIPTPFVGSTVADPRFQSFQENIDQVSTRLPKNLPGVPSPQETRRKVESKAKPAENGGPPSGQRIIKYDSAGNRIKGNG